MREETHPTDDGTANNNGGNGHPKPKNINKKPHKALSNKMIQEAAIKSDGSPTKMAKLLKTTKSTAAHHLRKPAIKEIILSERDKALKKVGLTRVRAYKRINEGLDATVMFFGKDTKKADHVQRLKAAKLTCEIYGDINPKDAGVGPKNIFNFYIPSKKPIQQIIDAVNE